MGSNMNELRTFKSTQLDIKENRQVKMIMQQNDDPILKFRVYNYGTPVDFTDLRVGFMGLKDDGELYVDTDNIEINNNEVTITCDRQLTTCSGRTECQLWIWDKAHKRVATYKVIIIVKPSVLEEDGVTVSQSVITILDKLDLDIVTAVDLEIKFKQDIEDAKEILELLESKITIADESKTQLQDKIDESNLTKADLITENQICQDSLQELKDQNDIVNQTIENGKKNVQEILEAVEKSDSANDSLNAKIEESEVAKGLLQDKIDEATSKLDEFKNFDTDELVEKTNKTYNKLMPTNELITINHNLYSKLKRKPIVQAISYTWGLGIGGLGEHPLGGSSSEVINGLGIIHEDSNTISLKVPEDYKMENTTVKKANDYEYIITNDTEKCITVLLI